MIRSQKIINTARGAACALRLPGICNNDPATTVWAHLNGFGKGMGMKTHDILGFPACSACHAAFDTDRRSKADDNAKDQKIEKLEAKLARKDSVMAELLEAHTLLKKELGEI